MSRILATLLISFALCLGCLAQEARPSRPIDVRSSDGTLLKGTYYAAPKFGPGAVLLHQSNRDRKSWNSVAMQLAIAGINTFTLDIRGFGESGGEKRSRAAEDVDAALEFCGRRRVWTAAILGNVNAR